MRPKGDTELELLKAAATASDTQIEDLIRKWRHPTFSIANVTSSGASNNTIIPRRVTSDVSFRLVPDQVRHLSRFGCQLLTNQDLDVVVEAIKTFCHQSFKELKSNNKLEVRKAAPSKPFLTCIQAQNHSSSELVACFFGRSLSESP